MSVLPAAHGPPATPAPAALQPTALANTPGLAPVPLPATTPAATPHSRHTGSSTPPTVTPARCYRLHTTLTVRAPKSPWTIRRSRCDASLPAPHGLQHSRAATAPAATDRWPG